MNLDNLGIVLEISDSSTVRRMNGRFRFDTIQKALYNILYYPSSVKDRKEVLQQCNGNCNYQHRKEWDGFVNIQFVPNPSIS